MPTDGYVSDTLEAIDGSLSDWEVWSEASGSANWVKDGSVFKQTTNHHGGSRASVGSEKGAFLIHKHSKYVTH